MKGSGKMRKDMAKEPISILMGKGMMVNGGMGINGI